jgi:glycosyltransferase involved in cell wall biosynthesis
MHITLVTDAWLPQVNGVVQTWSRVVDECERLGHRITVISPQDFRTVPLPTYREIRIAVLPGGKLRRLLNADPPDAVHIATEGPLGLATRRYCLRWGLPFTTSYHTKFPEYFSARFPVPLSWGYRALRWFHRPSSAVLVATPTVCAELEAKGFANIADWTRGVDTEIFRPDGPKALEADRPVFLYAGRVAVEKNLRAFLDLQLPGKKVVVGNGPQLGELQRDYPEVTFAGPKFGEDLAAWYRSAAVFVFPSRTDTFGLVLLEALASGVPVAAFPVPGPLDVIGHDGPGALDEDLGAAVVRAQHISSEECRAHSMRFSWAQTAAIFLDNLAVIEGER